MAETPLRRQLSFASLDDITADVRRLQDSHTTTGQWSLAQICNHLATAFRMSMRQNVPPSAEWNEERRRQLLSSGRFPDGVPAPHPALLPGSDLDLATEVRSLQETIDTFASFALPLAPHFRLGPMTHAEWTRFHCIHSGHHLEFTVPV